MIRHFILWQLKDEYSDEEKTGILENIKSHLEGLKGQVPGLTDIHVQICGLPSSSADAMLDSVLESADALAQYRVHPAHVHVADTYVRPFVKQRICMDFEI